MHRAMRYVVRVTERPPVRVAHVYLHAMSQQSTVDRRLPLVVL